jgi:hypothetical protein
VTLSVALYALHYLLFRDGQRIFGNLLEYVAFLPIQVLLVTLVIDGLMRAREKAMLLNKMNMVIGVFFGEVGADLLRHFSAFDPDSGRLGSHLILAPDWSDAEFSEARRMVTAYDCKVDARQGGLEELCAFLLEKRSFLLSLLENQNLLEHEAFSDLLWAVTHVASELSSRDRLTGLPDTDLEHLSGDIKRAYTRLIVEWLAYMQHLRNAYPYLYSLAVRTNPFDPGATAVCR